MFYTANKIITYPCKTILEDVLSRDGAPTKESYSPFMGLFNKMQSVVNNKSGIEYTIKDIIGSGRKDFSAEKARPNDDGVDREESASEVYDYHKRLEDIDDSFIEKYVSQVLTGFLWDNDGARRVNKNLQTFELWEDEEDGFVSPNDVLFEEEDFSIDDVEDAKKKLPYLLKILYEGSFKYKGSLLSFVIATSRFYRNTNGSKAIQPRNICAEGVYRIDKFGNTSEKFVVEDNTGTIFRTLFSWAIGEIQDRYYRAAQDLLKVCTILDIDITTEDARWYTSDVIEKAVCSYIASNEEYLQDYGFADVNILKALETDNVNNVIKNMDADFSNYNNEFIVYSLISDISTAIDILRTRNNAKWKLRPKDVAIFLIFYKNNIDNSISSNIRKYNIEDNILRKGDGEPILFELGKVRPGEYALLSATGHLICYEEFSSNYLRYMDVTDFMLCAERNVLCGWKVTSI